jgi:hypothetical protein
MAISTLITVPQFSRLVGLPNTPGIVDVRIDDDYGADPRLVPGSRRGGITEPSAVGRPSIGARASSSSASAGKN